MTGNKKHGCKVDLTLRFLKPRPVGQNVKDDDIVFGAFGQTIQVRIKDAIVDRKALPQQ